MGISCFRYRRHPAREVLRQSSGSGPLWGLALLRVRLSRRSPSHASLSLIHRSLWRKQVSGWSGQGVHACGRCRTNMAILRRKPLDTAAHILQRLSLVIRMATQAHAQSWTHATCVRNLRAMQFGRIRPYCFGRFGGFGHNVHDVIVKHCIYDCGS
jgi:hypothetical protein